MLFCEFQSRQVFVLANGYGSAIFDRLAGWLVGA